MTWARSIPLAPRPFSDESVRSWIGRIAARYDLEPPELLTRLAAGRVVYAARLASLDWQEDAELEPLLAQAARLDEVQIKALRLGLEARPEPARWHRQGLAWCPACACKDVACHGETYERAVWRLGCCAACPTHRLLLTDFCPVCTYGRVDFRAVAGRQRLVCALCKQLVDTSPEGELLAHRRGRFALVQRPEVTHLAFALQAVLLGVAAGSASTDPWRLGLSASRLTVVVRELAAALVWPEWIGLRPAHDKSAIAAVRNHVFAILEPSIAYEVLGIIASVLTAVAGGSPLRLRPAPIDGLALNGAAIDLAWVIRRLPADEQQWLRTKARQWGPVLARAVGDALNSEAAGRRRANAMREQARRDRVWLRHATVQYANDARRRIAARVAKRKAAALKRRQEQASSMTNSHRR